jgi:hypothetical protein
MSLDGVILWSTSMAKRLVSIAIVLFGLAFLWNFIPNLSEIRWSEPRMWIYATWILGTTAIVMVNAFWNAIRGFED